MRKKIESRPIESNQKQEAVSRTSNFYSRVSEGLKSAKDRMLESKKSLLLAMAALFALSTEAAAGVEIVVDGEVVNQVPEKKEQQKSPEKEETEDEKNEKMLDQIEFFGSVMKDKKIPDADRKIFEKDIKLSVTYKPVDGPIDETLTVLLTPGYFRAANYSPILINGKILKVAILKDDEFSGADIDFPDNTTGYERVVIESNNKEIVVSGSIYENYTQEIAKVSGYSIQATQKVVEKYSQKVTEVSTDMIRGVERVRDLFPRLFHIDTIRIINSDETNAFFSYSDALTMSISFTEAFGAKTMSSDVTEFVAMHESFHHIDFIGGINQSSGFGGRDFFNKPLAKLFRELNNNEESFDRFFNLLNEKNMLKSIGIDIGGHTGENSDELFASVMTTMLHPRFSEIVENINADEMQALYYASTSIIDTMGQLSLGDQKGYMLLIDNLEMLKAKFKEKYGDSKKDLLELKYHNISDYEILNLKDEVVLRLSKKLNCDQKDIKKILDSRIRGVSIYYYRVLDKLMKMEFEGGVTLEDFVEQGIIEVLFAEMENNPSWTEEFYTTVRKDDKGVLLLSNKEVPRENRLSGFGLVESEKTIQKWNKRINKLGRKLNLEARENRFFKSIIVEKMKNLNPEDQEKLIYFLEEVDIAPNVTLVDLIETYFFEKIIKFSQDYKESKFTPQIFKGEDGQIQIVSY